MKTERPEISNRAIATMFAQMTKDRLLETLEYRQGLRETLAGILLVLEQASNRDHQSENPFDVLTETLERMDSNSEHRHDLLLGSINSLIDSVNKLTVAQVKGSKH